MFQKKKMIVILAAMLSLPVFAQERGLPVFTDDFGTHMTFAELWKPGKGDDIKSQDGQVVFKNGGVLRMNRNTPEEFYAEMDLGLNGTHPKSSAKVDEPFAGFRIEGIRFGLLADGKCVLKYTPSGKTEEEEKNADIANFKPDAPIRLALARSVENERSTYRFLVNGKELFKHDAVAPSAVSMTGQGKDFSPLEITCSGADMTIDNFALSAVRRAGESPNLVVNSSFEHEQDGFPLYYTRGGSFDCAKAKEIPYEDYLATWSLDKVDKHSGGCSLKLVNNESTDGQSLTAWGAGTKTDVPGVFSIWMKADQEDFPVSISYGGGKGSSVVKVGKEWKRYEVVNPKLPGARPYYSPVSLGFKEKGVLWVDDLQAELVEGVSEDALKSGKPMATGYKPSEMDKARFTKQKAERTPGFEIARLPKGIVPDKNLDSWKDKATKLEKFYAADKPARNKTDVYLACDDSSLYVGYRNYGEVYTKPKDDKTLRDTFALFGSRATSIECFFDPDASGRFYQLAFASWGATDIGPGRDVTWNGNWKYDCVPNEKDGSVDYFIVFPMSDFATPHMKSAWPVNICRNDGAANECVASAKSPLVGFHQSAFWTLAKIPEDIAKAYRVGLLSASGTKTEKGIVYTVALGNYSGKERSVKAECFNMTGKGEEIAEKDLVLMDGENEFTFASGADMRRMRVKLTENGKDLLNQMMTVQNASPVSMLGRLSFYMNEPEAIFKVNANIPETETMKAVIECAGQKSETKAAPSFKIAIPLKNIPDGTHEAVLKLIRQDGSVAGTAKSTLVKRPYWEGATQINHFTRSLMHKGKPVFQFAPFIGDFSFANHFTPKKVVDMLELFDRYGFKYAHVLVPLGKEKSMETADAFFKAAVEKNFKVMLWTGYNHTKDDKVIDDSLNRLNYPNILSQLVMDEPELGGAYTSDSARDFLRKMRAKFPYQPTHMNNTVLGIPNRFANLETDILMLDDYLSNSENRPVSSVVNQADLMWEAGKEEGKPCFYFLVGGNFPLHYKEPSYGEQMAETYGCIAAGCTGFSYFYGFPQTPGNWKAYVQLNKEILALNDVLLSEEETADAKCDGDPKLLRFRTKKHDGSLYVIACNLDADPAGKVTFTLPAGTRMADTAEVLFEDRTLPIKDGVFNDTFDGHARHVYRIKIK